MLGVFLRRGAVCSALLVAAAATNDDDETATGGRSSRGFGKRRLVILGGGWASVALLGQLKSGLYDITVVSPRNYHVFTPLLPSVAVGTVEARTITEPLRELLLRYHLAHSARFYEAEATAVDLQRGVVHCVDRSAISAPPFELPYDRLVVAVGATSNSFGIGPAQLAEHCLFLKDVEDAKRIRDRIGDCFETAALPSLSADERRRLLSFVVVGGGPTGVEIAAELWDYIQEDLEAVYGAALVQQASVTVVQSASHVLNTYDALIGDYTQQHFARLGIDVITDARVVDVTAGRIELHDKAAGAARALPFGMCVWSTGIAPAPLVQAIRSGMPDVQTNRRALLVDSHMRVLLPGSDGGDDRLVFAIGDCASVAQTAFMQQAGQLFAEFDSNGDGALQQHEFALLLQRLASQRPDKALLVANLAQVFRDADADADGTVSLAEFKAFLRRIDASETSYPATAQVAAQQGAYVARLLSDPLRPVDDQPPFHYHHLGSLAYIGGNAAVVDMSAAPAALQMFGRTFGGSTMTMLFWRASYWNMQLSWRNKLSLIGDWTSTKIFGRDTSRV